MLEQNVRKVTGLQHAKIVKNKVAETRTFSSNGYNYHSPSMEGLCYYTDGEGAFQAYAAQPQDLMELFNACVCLPDF